MSIIANATRCVSIITGKRAAINGGDAVPVGHGTHRKAPQMRGFFAHSEFDATWRAQTRSTLTTFRAKPAARNHGHMLLHLRGMNRRGHGLAHKPKSEPRGEEMSSTAATVLPLVPVIRLSGCAFSCLKGWPSQAAFTCSNAVVTSASSKGSTFAASVSSYAYGRCSCIYVICDNSSCTACTPCAGCPYCRVM